MKHGPITELDVESWNAYVNAQQAKFPERSLRWEMHRMSIERVRELERVSEARSIVDEEMKKRLESDENDRKS